MAQRFAHIPALTPQNAAASTILVRTTRIWESINKKTKQVFHTNVVLLDQEDNQILATVRNTQKSTYFPLIAVGKVYEVSNAKVVNSPPTFRAVNRAMSLVFFHGTEIVPVDDTGVIPQYKFELTPLEDVAGLVNNITALIDVVAMVTEYGNLETATNGAQKLDIMVANERDKKMTITLWEDKAQQFQSALRGIEGVPVFAVISGLLAKTFANNASLSSTDATTCYLNIDYNPLSKLRDAIIAATGKSIDLLSPPTNRSFVAADANNLVRLSIKDILAYHLPKGEKIARCLCHAEITEILNGEGWYYNCCPKYARKVRLLDQLYFCDNCAENVPDLKQRYKLIVHVKDHSGTTSFTLFNKEVERLVRVPIEKLFSELSQNDPAAEIPTVLNNVVGKKCAFDVKINSYNTVLGYEEYTVVKLSELIPVEDDPAAESSETAQKKQKTT